MPPKHVLKLEPYHDGLLVPECSCGWSGTARHSRLEARQACVGHIAASAICEWSECRMPELTDKEQAALQALLLA